MSAKPGLIPALEGLRGVSILLVLASHAWMGHIVPGGLGVTIFFFISGFIITRTLLMERERNGHIGIGGFFMRRFFRLMPALFVFVALSCIAMYWVERSVPWKDVASAVFYYSNYWELAGRMHQGELRSIMSITWSLAVEQHYYFVFPFLFVLLVRLRPAWAVASLVGLCVLVLTWRMTLYPTMSEPLAHAYRIYKATDTRFDSIAFGVLASWLVWYYPSLVRRLSGPVWAAAGVALLLFTLLYRDPAFREVSRYSLQGVALLLLFPWTVLTSASLGSRALSHPWLLYVGKISYSLYLYHWLVFVLLDYYAMDLGFGLRVVLLLAFSFLLSDLSWRWVEQSGQKLRKLFLRRA